MKTYQLILTVFLIAFIPTMIDEAEAHHIANVNDQFFWKEIDNTDGNCAIRSYSPNHADTQSGFFIETPDTGNGQCAMFKVFNATDIDNKDIIVDGTWRKRTGTSSDSFFKIYDGAYDPTNSTQFPTDSPILNMGAGELYSESQVGDVAPQTLNININNTLSEVTVFFGWLEDNQSSAEASLYVNSITVEDLGTWDFCQVDYTDCINLRPVTSEGSGQLEYGSFWSYDIEETFVPNADVIDFGYTVTNNTSVLFDWTEIDNAGTGQQNVNTGINVTGYHIEYKNGTSAQSDYWLMLDDSVGDVETYQTGNIFEAGHTYTARIITVGHSNIHSEGSNEVTFTMSGTSASTQTFETAYYPNNDGVDNRFWWKEHAWGDIGSTAPHNGNCGYKEYTGTPSQGFRAGNDNGGSGNCYMGKSFLASAVMNRVWTLDLGANAYGGGPQYSYTNIVDGEYDPASSIDFPYEKNELSKGAGLLYQDTTPTDGMAFNPGNSNVLSQVTWIQVMQDDNGSADSHMGLISIDIADYEKFYIPNTTTLQSDFPATIHTANGEQGWGTFPSLFIPKPTLSTSLNSTDNSVDLTWNDPSDGPRWVAPNTGYKISQECPADLGWKNLVTDTGDTSLEYTVSDPFTGVEADYEETFTDDVHAGNYTTTNSAYFNYDTTTDTLEFDVRSDGVENYLYFPLPDGAVSDSNWVMEFVINWTDLTTGTAENYMYIGLNDGRYGSVYTDSMDFLGVAFWWDSSPHVIDVSNARKQDTSLSSTDTGLNLGTGNEGSSTYFKVTRTSTTNVNLQMWTGSNEDEDNLLLSHNKSITSSVNNLNSFIMTNIGTISVGNESYLKGQLDNLKINGLNIALQDPATSCNYRVYSISDLGTGYPSAESGVSLPAESNNAPTFTDIGPNSATINWSASGEADVTGYALQYSFDDSTWIDLNTNTTPDVSTNYGITGIDYLTTVYVRWADVIGGVTQTYSASGSFTTLGPQAGGGGNVPSTKTTIAPEDLTPEFIPPEPKKGLTALDIFSANVERIAPGETRKAVLEITWEGDTNLRVEEIIVDETTGLKFAFTQPIEFPPSSTGKTTSKIPYVIEAPAELCTEQQTPKCVYNDATYELPTQVFAFSNGESIKFDSTLTINVTDDFNLGMQEIFLGILGLVAVAFVMGRKKNTPGRRKSLGRKRRPNLG